MNNKEYILKKFRKLQTCISIILFFIIFLFCWNMTKFDLQEIQLSKWGSLHNHVGLMWNSIVCLLSVSIGINSFLYIKNNNRDKYKFLSYAMFMFISFSLFMIGLFNVNFHLIHNIFAFTFFFAYPLAIFIMNYLNRKNFHYKNWVHNLIMSICMAIIPITLIGLFKGMAIAETAHIIIIVVWNLYIAFKHNN